MDSIISEEFLHEKFELLFHLRDFCPCVLFSELFSLATWWWLIWDGWGWVEESEERSCSVTNKCSRYITSTLWWILQTLSSRSVNYSLRSYWILTKNTLSCMIKGSEIKPFDLSLYEDLHQKFIWSISPGFVEIFSLVVVKSCWQANKPTNKQT